MTFANANTDTPQRELFFSDGIAEGDQQIFDVIQAELARQQDQIELIASENIVSKAVLDAQG